MWPRLRRVGRPATPVLPEPHGEEDQGNERRPYADGEADDDAGGPASPSVGRRRHRRWSEWLGGAGGGGGGGRAAAGLETGYRGGDDGRADCDGTI